jgi:hypothetical protein
MERCHKDLGERMVPDTLVFSREEMGEQRERDEGSPREIQNVPVFPLMLKSQDSC